MAWVSKLIIQPAIREAPERLRPLIEAQVKKTAQDIETGAKARCPVDTGMLRASILAAATSDPLTWEIEPHTDYAGYVEFGTGQRGIASNYPGKPDDLTYRPDWPGMTARPYLTPAALEQEPAFEYALSQLVERAFK